MDYLRGTATASATGLFVICRHLARHTEGRTEQDLRQSLQLLRSGADDPGPILEASLVVAEGLGLLRRTEATGSWVGDPEVGRLLQGADDAWPVFRRELLHRISEQAVHALAQGDQLPDLVSGITLLMQSDPLSPDAASWSEGPEKSFEALGFSAIGNSTQWNAFKRWVTSLGLARRANATRPSVFVPDATTAIADNLDFLPASGSARTWLASLGERLPILGSIVFTSKLPQSRVWNEIPPAVVLGLLKLERSGRLQLQPSDDASDVISFGLGTTSRQIGRVSVVNGCV